MSWNLRIAPLERAELHTKIELRFKAMLDAGFVAEVRSLYERGDLSAEHPSMRAVGYRQVWRHLAGQCALKEAEESGDCGDATTREAAVDLAAAARARTVVGFHASGGCTRDYLMHCPRADLRSGLPYNASHALC